MPEIAHAQIQLWDKGKDLGMIPLGAVMQDYLGPGKMLALKDRVPTKLPRLEETLAPRGVAAVAAATTTPLTPPPWPSLEYEILQFPTGMKSDMAKRTKRPKGLRAREARLTVTASKPYLKHTLHSTYHFFANAPVNERGPVEIHIHSREKISSSASDPLDWTRLVRGRMDLHPEVILRALPEGAVQLVETVVSAEGADMVFVIAPANYSWAKRHNSIEAGKDAGAGVDIDDRTRGTPSEFWTRKFHEKKEKARQFFQPSDPSGEDVVRVRLIQDIGREKKKRKKREKMKKKRQEKKERIQALKLQSRDEGGQESVDGGTST